MNQRLCPNPTNNLKCKRIIVYKTIGMKEKADMLKTLCSSCKHIGHKHSEETKQKMAISISKATKGRPAHNKGKKGPPSPMKGKTYEEMYGVDRSKKIINKMVERRKLLNNYVWSEKSKKKLSDAFKGKSYKERYGRDDVSCGFKKGKDNVSKNQKNRKLISERVKGDNNPSKRPEVKQKIRLKLISRLEMLINNGGQIKPWYNPKGCQYFNQLMEQTGTHIQHAENGGEYYIKELGYWVDGYDEKNNIVYEWDEKHHFDVDGSLCERDVQRQKEIEEFLKCKFIRIKQ